MNSEFVSGIRIEILRCSEQKIAKRIKEYAICFLWSSFFLFVPLFAMFGEAGERFRVVVANGSLGINHIITARDVRIALKNNLRTGYTDDLREVIGKRVKRPIGRNNPVKIDYLQAALGVKRGELVSLVAEKGNLKITVKGMVKENGVPGDVVRVENISSGKLISGRVVNSGLVRVDF